MSRRNPRRAYNPDGSMIEPAKVSQEREQGIRTVMVYCSNPDCRHSGTVSTDPFPDDFRIPDIALKVRCSVCGEKRVSVMLDGKAHHALMQERRGQSGR